MFFSWFEKKIDPFPTEMVSTPPRSFLPFVWHATKGVRGYILGMGLLAAVLGVFEAILFAILGKIVDWLDRVEPASFWTEEGHKLILLACVILSSILLVAIQTMLKYQTLAGNFPMRLRWQFHRLLLRQSMSFFQDEFAGRIATKVMQTALAVRDFYMIVMDILIFATIYFITITVTVGYFDVFLLIPFSIWLFAYLGVLRWIIPKLARTSQEQADARSTMVGRVTDAYTNIATVKLFSHAKREAYYAKSAMSEFMTTVHAMMRQVSSFQMINHTLSVLLTLSSIGLALWLWMNEQTGVGTIAAVAAMALRLSGMSQWIMFESAQLFEHVGTVHDGMNTLSHPQKVNDVSNATELKVTQGDIRFENLTFSYDGDPLKKVIHNFSLHIKPGEKIGLVGRSGAGKSTLVSLLLRFHDVQGGEILIDNQNIATVTQDSLRANIGIVMQDTSLLHRSVRDNILYGKPDATEDDMIAAAKRAEADGFIAHLMDSKGRKGYDAHVGERGVTLSGGQRQRIAIARVMLKDAPILLLDEATSALDSEVEIAIQDNLYRLMEGKTVVAIAHRLSTIAAMDRLIVVDGGNIVEEGDHACLLAKNGVYARLWTHQSGGFLGVDE